MTDIGLNKVYVINLDKDFERLKNIEANFKKYNISYTRVPGVYGKNLTKDEIDSVTTPICRMFSCNKGIIGSGLSHFKALQTVSKERDGFYMICEDDINFNDNTIQYLNDIFKNYPFLAGAFVAAGAAADLAGAPPVATRNASSISLGKVNFNFIATLIERLSAIEG